MTPPIPGSDDWFALSDADKLRLWAAQVRRRDAHGALAGTVLAVGWLLMLAASVVVAVH